MNDHPIFLVGAHKSGTSLLRSVLDGHPDLFTVPFETHYFQNMHYWVDCNYRMKRPKKLNQQQMVDRFTALLDYLNESKDAIGDIPLKFHIDTAAFRNVFQKATLEMDDRARFKLYMNALYHALHNRPMPPDRRVVEKSVEHAEFASLLNRMFPDARFVHILRNPYANIVSLRKYKNIKSQFPLVFRLLQTLYNNYYYLYTNRKLIDNYYIIRYEDLLEEPEIQIRKLADFLDIRFTSTLLEPTKFGNPWQGNSSAREELSGFDASRVHAWETEISPMEIRFINTLFPFVLDDFGYQRLPTPGLFRFLRPLAGEGPLRYLLNRMYLGYISYEPWSEI